MDNARLHGRALQFSPLYYKDFAPIELVLAKEGKDVDMGFDAPVSRRDFGNRIIIITYPRVAIISPIEAPGVHQPYGAKLVVISDQASVRKSFLRTARQKSPTLTLSRCRTACASATEAKGTGRLRIYLNQMGTTCLHRAREFANKVQKAKIDPLIDNNFVQVEFLSRVASPRRLEMTTENVDVLGNKLADGDFKSAGLYRYHPLNTHLLQLAEDNNSAQILFFVNIPRDFLIDMAYLPKTSSNVRVNVPLKKGHQVSIDLNHTDNGEEQSGLSRIDGKALPPGFRVPDTILPLKPAYMQIRGIHRGENRIRIIVDRIQESSPGEYATFYFERTFNTEDATILPEYEMKDGDEAKGIGLGAKGAIDVYALNLGLFPDEPELRDVRNAVAH